MELVQIVPIVQQIHIQVMVDLATYYHGIIHIMEQADRDQIIQEIGMDHKELDGQHLDMEWVDGHIQEVHKHKKMEHKELLL